jgi:hypothetical protein
MLLLEHIAIRRRYLPACLILWSSSNKTVLLQATNFHFSHFLPRHAQRVRFRKRDTGGRVGRSSRQAGPTQRVTSLSRLYCLEQWYSTGGTRRHLRGVRRLYNLYNLHYVPTTLGVQSWREIISGGTQTKKVEYHWPRTLWRLNPDTSNTWPDHNTVQCYQHC